jgi:hypothetical protein
MFSWTEINEYLSDIAVIVQLLIPVFSGFPCIVQLVIPVFSGFPCIVQLVIPVFSVSHVYCNLLSPYFQVSHVLYHLLSPYFQVSHLLCIFSTWIRMFLSVKPERNPRNVKKFRGSCYHGKKSEEANGRKNEDGRFILIYCNI